MDAGLEVIRNAAKMDRLLVLLDALADHSEQLLTQHQIRVIFASGMGAWGRC